MAHSHVSDDRPKSLNPYRADIEARTPSTSRAVTTGQSKASQSAKYVPVLNPALSVLTAPSTVHRSEIFFVRTPELPPRVPAYIRRASQQHPPVPPKVFPSSPAPPLVPGKNEMHFLAKAMALSEQESVRRRQELDEIHRREEEDLAIALEASRLSVRQDQSHSQLRSYNSHPTNGNHDHASPDVVAALGSSIDHIATEQNLKNEETAIVSCLKESESVEIDVAEKETTPCYATKHTTMHDIVEAGVQTPISSVNSCNSPPLPSPVPPLSGRSLLRPRPRPPSIILPATPLFSPETPRSSSVVPELPPKPPAYHPRKVASLSETPIKRPPARHTKSDYLVSQPNDTVSSYPSQSESAVDTTATLEHENEISNSLSGGTIPSSLRSVSSVSSLSPTYANVDPNDFVDAELFVGVSIGFTQPTLHSEPVPMGSIMPNIVTLPFGRCPPLHLQATSWRHLLKLTAMLSGSRLEVSPDVTILKPQLRTVVQFAKPHVSSSVWCTILWLSIDQEIPKQLPAHVRTKYAAGIDTLPWSYTQAAIPELLRHGHDTIISKYFTIPSSATVPYPDLPISFPNLALYLQAALDASRRSPSDSGQRRLAKMIDFCYPTLRLEEDEPSGSVGGLFKKAFARGKLPKSGKKKRGINEDTYELVTPFVPDEWG